MIIPSQALWGHYLKILEWWYPLQSLTGTLQCVSRDNWTLQKAVEYVKCLLCAWEILLLLASCWEASTYVVKSPLARNYMCLHRANDSLQPRASKKMKLSVLQLKEIEYCPKPCDQGSRFFPRPVSRGEHRLGQVLWAQTEDSVNPFPDFMTTEIER